MNSLKLQALFVNILIILFLHPHLLFARDLWALFDGKGFVVQ